MCGIVGFTGHQQAAPILLEGLSKLEYRGYDSAGLAVRDGENLTEVVKSTGKLRNLADKTDNGLALHGTCGIGHTRWATHGEPSQINAHPHVSGNCTHMKNVYYIGNLQLARLTPGKAVFYDLNGDEIEVEPTEITYSAEAAEKGL